MTWGYRELDKLVARALPELQTPWHAVKTVFFPDGRSEHTLDGESYLTEQEAMARATELGAGWDAVPFSSPSVDLGDSFFVLDALAHKASVEEANLRWKRGKGWQLCFEGEVQGCVYSESLCEAICQGALLVSQVSFDGKK